ncbi:signal peptidase I [Argonema antarcticum A004/B2]|nr:signal peptidase I [Argonema antarcticum]MCL1471577.1 signal peptidase I [Argonema antarcticum A004/B2]
MSNQPTSGKEPWLAVILSTFFPGIGQIYAGQVVRGVVFIIVQIALIFLGGWLVFSPSGNIKQGIILLLATILVTIPNIFDAHRCARKANSADFERLRKSNKDPWLAVFLSQILPGLGHLYIGKWWLGILLIIIWVVANIVPLVSILILIILPFVAYNAYISAPVRRETSKKLIKTICVFLIVVPLFSVVLAILLRAFVLEVRYIPSGTMLPTLQINDRLLIDKLIYRFQKPQRGDIVVFSPTDTLIQQNLKDAFIKRIIGLPGEKVEVKGEKVYINDQPLQENYIAEAPDYQYGPVTVPPNSYFVLGDDRNNSYDSHYWGFVPRELIIGKATKRYWPPDRIGSLK